MSEFGISVASSFSDHSSSTCVELTRRFMDTGATRSIDEHRDGVVGTKVLPFLKGICGELLRDGGDHAQVTVVVEDGG